MEEQNMLAYPVMDPIAFHLLSWPVYWYGLMYLVGFVVGWGLLRWRLSGTAPPFTDSQLSDMVFYTALGVIIGGRFGYMIFYDGRALFAHPLLLFQTWKGGMSFHGGMVGVILALFFYAQTLQSQAQKTIQHRLMALLKLTDFIAPVVPVGLGAGRIGNFINGELWGRVTTVPWAMIFPRAGALPRHPSQLYEAGLEGLLLFLVVWSYSRRPRPIGAVSGLFTFCYGVFRCIAECFREADAQIGYIAFGWLTEGQLLSFPLIIGGGALLIWSYRSRDIAEKG
jgi:phosphatidylglycerol---prolipoprotein diacylglyceryl transferase